MIRVWFNICL